MADKITEVLTDLIQINNDRVIGYEIAAEQTKGLDADLFTIFNNMAKNSRKYAAELTEELNKINNSHLSNDISKEKNQRLWMEVNTSFPGYDRQSILESCELGEFHVQKAYNAALAFDDEVDAGIRIIIINQKALLKSAHKLIKNYRDARWKMSA